MKNAVTCSIQWLGDNCVEVSDFLGSDDFHHKAGTLFIHFSNGDLLVYKGYYLARLANGTFISSKTPLDTASGMNSPFIQTVYDRAAIVEKESKRKVSCVWCTEPIQPACDFVYRSIQTDSGLIIGNFHLGCSSALNASSDILIRKGWVKGTNTCGQPLTEG